MTDGIGGPGRQGSRRRFLGIAGAALLVTGGAAVTGPFLDGGSQRGRLLRRPRIASFNIHHGASPDGKLDLERIARLIEAMDCDVVGLQEVDRFAKRSDRVDQPQWLAKRLDLHVAFGRNEKHDRRREYGNAILSRWPVTDSDNTLLPRFDDHEQRGLLRAVIAAPKGELTVASTHLMHDDNADERVAQAEAIVAKLGDSPKRTVLVGDFNARPGSDPIELLCESFTDSWAVAGNGDGHSYPSLDPHKRIDYLFASADLEPRSPRLQDTDPAASDHLPVVGGFTMRPKR